jgi:polyphosphate kinase
VRDPELRRRVLDEGLSEYLADTCDAWSLRSDGEWARVKPRGRAPGRSAQQALLARMREPDEAD